MLGITRHQIEYAEVTLCDFGGEARKGGTSTWFSLGTLALGTQLLGCEEPLAPWRGHGGMFWLTAPGECQCSAASATGHEATPPRCSLMTNPREIPSKSCLAELRDNSNSKSLFCFKLPGLGDWLGHSGTQNSTLS